MMDEGLRMMKGSFLRGGGANYGLHRVDCSAFEHLCRQMCEVMRQHVLKKEEEKHRLTLCCQYIQVY